MSALHDIVKKGSTDRSVTVRIIDSADGTPETGVVYNTSGIDLWYRREGAAKTSITEATLAALTTAHSDGGFLHISDGVYRLDLPDAAFATGANYVDFGGTVTGMVVIGGRVRLVNYDPEDAVRLGVTALPNANADAAGGLPISDAGGLDLDSKLANTDQVTTARMGALTDWIDGGRLDLLVDALLARLTSTRAGYLDNLNGHTPQTGDAFARLGAPNGASTAADIAAVKTVADAVKAKTDNLPSDPADQSLIIDATNAIISAVGAVDGVVDGIKVTTDKLDDTLEDDSGTYRFTVNALEQAPAGGGGGSTDWTADERTAIRAILGVPGSGTTPADPSTGILDTIRDAVGTKASQSSVDDIPTNAELATALAAADDAVLAQVALVKAATDNLPSDPADQSLIIAATNAIAAAISALNNLSAAQVRAELATELARLDVAVSTRLATAGYTAPLDAAGVRSAVGIGSANLDTQLGDLPTNAELAASQAAADDATLAAIAALPSASTIASAVLSAAGSAPIAANVKEINDAGLTGNGTSGNPWGPA